MNILNAISMLVLVVTPALSQTTCVGHFYNQSNYAWSIVNFDGHNTSVLIQPNTTFNITWGVTDNITISGNTPEPYIRRFQVQPMDSCVNIIHQGSAGSVTLNKPNPGDITTCSGTCQ
jgi:hypothetical protein